jgi:hypothetical protein
MSRFRGADDRLDREIATLEQIVRVRVRRTAAELRALERDLHELRKERARRRAMQLVPTAVAEPTAEMEGGS